MAVAAPNSSAKDLEKNTYPQQVNFQYEIAVVHSHGILCSNSESNQRTRSVRINSLFPPLILLKKNRKRKS